MNQPTTPRPSRKDPAVLQKVAEALAPKLVEWMHDPLGPNVSEATRDLMEELPYATNLDGYEIAYRLDRDHCYSPDTELVNILDEASSIAREAHDQLCEQWVKDNNLTPPAEGAKVTSRSLPQTHGVGTIITNNSNGTSCVNFPLLGHIMPGTGNGTIGQQMTWEDLIPA